MVKAIKLHCKSYQITIGGSNCKRVMLRIALYYRALYKITILPVFRSKNDFRDFDGKEMQVKYDFLGL